MTIWESGLVIIPSDRCEMQQDWDVCWLRLDNFSENRYNLFVSYGVRLVTGETFSPCRPALGDKRVQLTELATFKGTY